MIDDDAKVGDRTSNLDGGGTYLLHFAASRRIFNVGQILSDASDSDFNPSP
jgi:hypothetical protein